jgi:hypothetical protein
MNPALGRKIALTPNSSGCKGIGDQEAAASDGLFFTGIIAGMEGVSQRRECNERIVLPSR